MVTRGTEVLALWASEREKATLSTGVYYELSWYEVNPGHVKQGLGFLCLSLVSARAAELGCGGLVIHSVDHDDAKALYKKAGARQGVPPPWQARPPLLPYTIDGLDFCSLVEAANEALVQEAPR